MNLEPELTADEAGALAALTTAGAAGVMDVTVTEAEPGADQPVPFTLTPRAEAALDTEPEPLPDPDPEVGGWPGWSDPSILAPDRDPEPEAEL